MKKKLTVIAMFFLFILPGCFSSNNIHNIQHSESFKTDLQLMHKDIDSFLGSDEPSSLTDY